MNLKEFIEKQQVVEKVVRWLQSPYDTPGPFRRIFTVMYIGLIAATIIYLNLDSYRIPGTLIEEPLILGIFLALLLGIELFEHNRYDSDTPQPAATLFLVARTILLALVSWADTSGVSLFLYPIIPFVAFFAYGLRVSNILGVISFGVCVWQVAQMTSDWNLTTDVLILLIISTELLIFMQAMAMAIHRDEESRRHTKRLLANLASSHQQLQTYAEQVADLAAAEERNRLARDIHDSLGHHLTAINIQLEKALAYRQRAPDEAEQAILDALQSAKAALKDVRRSVGTLRDTDVDFRLKDALTDLVERMGNAPFSIHLSISGDETGYSHPKLMALYRAAQEGLTNVQKHAGACHVDLKVELGRRHAYLVLEDDGKGLPPSQMVESTSLDYNGYGLQGLQERLDLIGGQITLESFPYRGTKLRVIVPKHRAG